MTRRAAGAHRYAFGSTVLELAGPRALLHGFTREYGPPAAGAPQADVIVSFGAVTGDATLAGRHKTVGWRVALSPPDAEPLRATVDLRGAPRGFARSLVQGFVVEPLLSVAVARSGRVLLPAAAFERDGEAVLLVGRSRSGKTTLMAGAAARGLRVLGDDQVVVEPAGRVGAFPRRLRLYTDLPRTAPAAHAGLAARSRARLRALTALRTLSAGYVAPSMPVPIAELGPAAPAAPLPLTRIVLIERSAEAAEIIAAPLEPAAAAAWARPVLAEQRARLAAAGGGWRAALDAVADAEEAMLEAAFAGRPAERLRVPGGWDAARSVAALAERLGL